MSYFLLYTKELVLFKLTFFHISGERIWKIIEKLRPISDRVRDVIDWFNGTGKSTNESLWLQYNLKTIENLKISGSRHFIAWRGTNSSILIPGSSDLSGKNRKILFKYFYLQMSIEVVVYYLSMLCNWYLNKMLV